MKAGVPILTFAGNVFSSRVAASLLNSFEATELIVFSLKEYESKAVEIANNSILLKEIKNKLNLNRFTTSLFKTSEYAINLESAYLQMYQRYNNNLKPDHLDLAALNQKLL